MPGPLPRPGLIRSFLGHSWDVELRPGEASTLDTAEAAEAARRFRDVLSRFASGVVVVTGTSAGEPVGLTCQSFTSVSLDPPLVLFCPARTSRSWPHIERSGSFCVNVLSERQQDVSDTFAARGADKFAAVEWRPSPVTRSPLLAGVVGYVDCAVHAVHDGGDHLVVLGRVVDLGDAGAEGPEHGLTYHRGQYGSTR